MPPKKLLLFFCIIAFVQVCAQDEKAADSLRQLVLAARLHGGFIFAHSVHVQNTKGTHPDGFEFDISRLRTDSAVIAKFKCYPRSGFSFTYTDFNKRLLGRSYSLSYFLEPNYRLSDYLRFNFRASAGLSYLTNPHDAIKNPDNESYSGHINSFLQLGLGLELIINHHLGMYGMANFFHSSNGGFKLPNAGVNYVNASIGFKYYDYSTRLPVYKKQKDLSWKQNSFHINASFFAAAKDGYNTDSSSRRKALIGTSVQAVKCVSNLDAITASAEIYYDDALRSIKSVYVRDTSSNFLAGITIGHQFLLNRFTFSQELGVYILKQTQKYNSYYQNLFHPLYQRYGLSYHIRDRWTVGISMLTHYQIADFVDGRVIFRLK